MASTTKISSDKFYNEYHGHRVEDLKVLIEHFKEQKKIWLVGDSSLDNKHWILNEKRVNAVNGFEKILDKTDNSVADVAYALNNHDDVQKNKFVVINAAIEESTVEVRQKELQPQDLIVRDNLSSDDIIIISVGGNDIGLKPTMETMSQMTILLTTNTKEQLSGVTLDNCDYLPGFLHFKKMFGEKVQNYAEKLIEKTKPAAILISTIYYPDMEVGSGKSWADAPLAMLQYNNNPTLLQALIDQVYKLATSQIKIKDVKIIPLALSDCLNGSETKDYIARVEPSVSGGIKMANLFTKKMFSK